LECNAAGAQLVLSTVTRLPKMYGVKQSRHKQQKYNNDNTSLSNYLEFSAPNVTRVNCKASKNAQ